MDVSYGGLRLELPDRGSLPKSFDVEVAGIGLHLEVEPVWSYPSQTPAEPSRHGSRASHPAGRHLRARRVTWRPIVDPTVKDLSP